MSPEICGQLILFRIYRYKKYDNVVTWGKNASQIVQT